MRIAVDAMGGDHAPGRVVDGALAAARHLGIGVDLVGRPDAHRATNSRATTIATRSTSRVDRGDRRRRDGRVAGAGAAAQAAARRSESPPSGWPADEAAALVSVGHTGAAVVAAHARVRHAARRRSSGAGAVGADARRLGGAARCRRDGRVQAGVPAAVRGDGRGLRAGVAGRRAAARRPAVDRRGRNQGQRADARGASAAEGVAAALCRQRRSARHLLRAGRRDRVRRLHRQRRAEAERRARRDGRGPARRGAAEHVLEPGRLLAVAPGVPAVPQARGLLGIRRRAADGRRRALHRRPRPVVGQGGAQRRGDGVAVRRAATCWRASSRRLRRRR